MAIPDEVFGEHVCIYIELEPTHSDLSLDDLLDRLEHRGTSKEIRPEAIVVLDALPRSSGAKIAKGEIAADAAHRFTP